MEAKDVKRQFMSTMISKNVVLELLDKGVSNLKFTVQALNEKNYQRANDLIIDTENILLELQAMMKNQDRTSKRTYEVLECIAEELFFANLQKDEKRVKEVLVIMERLKAVYEDCLENIGGF